MSSETNPKEKLTTGQAVLVKVEWGVALALTGLVLLFHLGFVQHAGGLWRDEANTIALSTLPRLSDVWANLQFDSFPMLWLMVVRTLSHLGWNADWQFRVLGAGVGLGVIAAFWFNARQQKLSFPFFSLSLIGCGAATIRYGDSMRAYGFGLLWMVLMITLMWKLVEEPSTRRAVWTGLCAIASVQTLYYNSVLLFAVCVGAVAVALRRRQFKVVIVILGIGLVAGLSMLPYIEPLQSATSWNMIIRVDEFDFSLFLSKLDMMLAPGGLVMEAAWVLSLMLVVIAAACILIVPGLWRASAREIDLAWYSSVSLVTGVSGYYLFLKLLRYPTRDWYYMAFLTFAAVSFDTMFSLVAKQTFFKLFRLVLALIVACFAWAGTKEFVEKRFTTIDLVATRLQSAASEKDVILVEPWYCAVTFQRYYMGRTPWDSVPPMPFHKFHRYDLLKQAMSMTNQMDCLAPTFHRIQETLRSGNRVWVVSDLDYLEDREPTIPAPAPNSSSAWADYPFLMSWREQNLHYLHQHATNFEEITIESGPVSWMEGVGLGVFNGWRQSDKESAK